MYSGSIYIFTPLDNDTTPGAAPGTSSNNLSITGISTVSDQLHIKTDSINKDLVIVANKGVEGMFDATVTVLNSQNGESYNTDLSVEVDPVKAVRFKKLGSHFSKKKGQRVYTGEFFNDNPQDSVEIDASLWNAHCSA